MAIEHPSSKGPDLGLPASGAKTHTTDLSSSILFPVVRTCQYFLSITPTSREVHEARLPRTCSRTCAFEVNKTKKKNTKSHQTLNKHTTKYIDGSPAIATTSRRLVTKHPLRVSPSSHVSIHPGFVDIGLACIRTRTAAAPLLYILVLNFLASAASFSTVIFAYISGFGVVRWCLTLSFP